MGLYASQPVNQRTSDNQSTTSGPKLLPKIHQTRSKVGPKSVLEGVLGRLGGSWGGSWALLGSILAPRGPKSPKNVQQGTVLIATPPLGGQNGAKIGPKSIQNLIIFLVACWITFKSILVPIWLQLGSQKPPKMEPSWVQNRPNLEHRFGS